MKNKVRILIIILVILIILLSIGTFVILKYIKNEKDNKKDIPEIANKYSMTLIDDARVMLLTKEAGIDPYISDSNHPNEYGTYVVALCMYAKVFNEDPRNVTWHVYIDDTNIVNKLKRMNYIFHSF